ncbi:hypothetical protein ACHAQJ_001290 [Trichoderma viride]
MDLLFSEEVTKAGTTECQRPRKNRVLNAARREQNRSAQRAYRQRQKEQREKQRDEGLQRSLRRPIIQLLPRPSPDEQESHSPSQFDHAAQPECSSSSSNRTKPTSDPWDSISLGRDSFSSPFEISSFTAGKARDNQLELSDAEDVMLTDRIRSRHSGQMPWRTKDDQAAFLACKSPPYMADPVASGIHFMQTTVFSAIFHNAMCLGFDLNQLATCRFTYISPFYQPNATPQTDPKDLLASANLPTSSKVPPNLYPTLAQLLIPHHACLDLIPLPLLRERAIMLSAAMPFSYDLTEFKRDIFRRGGLMVWSTDATRLDNTVINAKSGCLQPWDRECWEAAPWFLEKWSIAVDGQQGELGRQSSRWKKLREAQTSSIKACML